MPPAFPALSSPPKMCRAATMCQAPFGTGGRGNVTGVPVFQGSSFSWGGAAVTQGLNPQPRSFWTVTLSPFPDARWPTGRLAHQLTGLCTAAWGGRPFMPLPGFHPPSWARTAAPTRCPQILVLPSGPDSPSGKLLGEQPFMGSLSLGLRPSSHQTGPKPSSPLWPLARQWSLGS